MILPRATIKGACSTADHDAFARSSLAPQIRDQTRERKVSLPQFR